MKTNLKHFNLEAALNGEPVMLRDGRKAFVRHHETEVMVGDCWQIWGTTIESPSLIAWSKGGGYYLDGDISGLDIIGMWTEPRITRIINGFEVPAPETEEPKRGDWYYRVCLIDSDFYDSDRWNGDDVHDVRPLKRGLIFLKKEDAIANAKAMLGIDPHVETEA
jgi:hypothetical protein